MSVKDPDGRRSLHPFGLPKSARSLYYRGVALILDIDLKLREQPSVTDEVSIL